MTKVFAISGRTASGKTTLARTLSEALKWKLGSFGNFVRHKASKRGFTTLTRKVIQDLGQELVTTDVERFCRDYLTFIDFHRGECLVLDGIRHLEVLRTMQSETQSSATKLVHVIAEVNVRKARFERLEPTEQFEVVDSHPVEAGNDLLAGMSDFTIDTSTLAAGDAQARVVHWASAALR